MNNYTLRSVVSLVIATLLLAPNAFAEEYGCVPAHDWEPDTAGVQPEEPPKAPPPAPEPPPEKEAPVPWVPPAVARIPGY